MVLIFRLVDLSLRDKRLSRETKYLCEEYVKLLWMEKASSIGSAKRGSLAVLLLMLIMVVNVGHVLQQVWWLRVKHRDFPLAWGYFSPYHLIFT
jgi:hypothetical protein